MGGWSEIGRNRLSFISIGVFSMYGKILLAYSIGTFIPILLAFSTCALKYFGEYEDDFVKIKPL